MKFEAMFQPVKIGNMTVPNRFVMVRWEIILRIQTGR